MTLKKFAVFTVLFAGMTGCAHANFAASPGQYSVEGTSYHPEAMAATLSGNYVQETNAITYRDCVMSGRCFAYLGGGYGNDYAYYWGGVVPPQPQQPAATGTVANGQPQGDAVDVCARAMAADALRAQAGKPLKGMPPGCKFESR